MRKMFLDITDLFRVVLNFYKLYDPSDFEEIKIYF